MYGSYARGDYDSDSDIDIVAIVHGDRKILQEQLKKVWDSSCELELQYETILSPTVIPYKEFQRYQKELPYYRNIAQEGVIVDIHGAVQAIGLALLVLFFVVGVMRYLRQFCRCELLLENIYN